MVGPSRQPRPAPHHEPGRRAPEPPAAHRPQAPPAAPRSRPHREHPRHQRVDPPDFSQPVPTAPDVCALGRRYGGWQPDSPASVICNQTYGH